MKAINFLEWFDKYAPEDTSFHDTHIYFAPKIIKVMEFYSQPFKPELITELFDTFQTRGDFNRKPAIWFVQKDYNPENQVSAFEVDWLNGWTVMRVKYLATTYEIPTPQTIDEFIMFCQRAGIELTFKPEIADKYFN